MAANPTATVTNVQRYSLHDGGGIRTNVFLKGCPFRCPWCCNPENLSREPEISFKPDQCMGCSHFQPGSRLCDTPPELCPKKAKTRMGETKSVDELMDQMLRDAAFYEESGGGVTVSGGEALTWPEFLAAFMARSKQELLQTALETTLALPLPDDVLAQLAKTVDVWLVDFKIADAQRSLEQIGLNPAIRDESLRRLRALLGDEAFAARVVARMPIIPGYTDQPDNVAANLGNICDLGLHRVDVLPFHQLGSGKYDSMGRAYTMGDVPQLTDEDVAWIVDAAAEKGLDARLHGE